MNNTSTYNLHNRKSIRLKGYDYSQAGYTLLLFVVKTGNVILEKQKM